MIDSQEDGMHRMGEALMLAKAIRIAANVHEAQVDKGQQCGGHALWP